ncbi:hypothetical protein HDU92_001707 [Lobulomyces angularis]|nr:hypothetical protein HDU92_001707 [Lobulomyces angularis]
MFPPKYFLITLIFSLITSNPQIVNEPSSVSDCQGLNNFDPFTFIHACCYKNSSSVSIACDSNNRVLSVDVNKCNSPSFNKNFVPTSFPDTLTQLRSLSLKCFKLSDIPTLKNSTLLESLILEDNLLNTELKTLNFSNTLKHLSLTSNLLSGQILPDSFLNFKNLISLNLSKNYLSGGLNFLEPLTELKELNLEYNLFSGPLPQLTNTLSSCNINDLGISGVCVTENHPSSICTINKTLPRCNIVTEIVENDTLPFVPHAVGEYRMLLEGLEFYKMLSVILGLCCILIFFASTFLLYKSYKTRKYEKRNSLALKRNLSNCSTKKRGPLDLYSGNTLSLSNSLNISNFEWEKSNPFNLSNSEPALNRKHSGNLKSSNDSVKTENGIVKIERKLSKLRYIAINNYTPIFDELELKIGDLIDNVTFFDNEEQRLVCGTNLRTGKTG